MMRSLSSGVAGLRAHQTKMDVIGTNIANVNTYGFKSSRVSFSDVYYQTLSSGSAPTSSLGGTNPTQIGYGSAVATIDVMNAQAGMMSTDRALDIYIDGDGMIATKDANGNLFYTRLGVLGFDAEGNLVDSNGYFVQGFPVDKDGNPQIGPDGTIDADDLSKITVDKEMLDQMTGISIGSTGEIIGIMPGDTEISLSKKRPEWLFDMQIKPDSNIVGDVKVTMEYRSDAQGLPFDWIKEVNAKTNSRLDGGYSFAYDNGVITATGANNNDVLTGTYRRGGEVEMKNAAGQVVLTITTDPLNGPGPSDVVPGNTVDFTSKLMLGVEYNDKGGNKTTDEVEYTGQTNVVFGDITLTLDPTKAEDVTNATFQYNTGSNFVNGTGAPPAGYEGWLKGASLDSASNYSGEISLAAGIKQTVGLNIGTNDALNFLDKDKITTLVKTIGAEGGYKIKSIPVNAADPSQGFTLQISTKDGQVFNSNAVTKPGQTILFTPPGLDIGATTTAHFQGVGLSGISTLSQSGIQNLLNTDTIKQHANGGVGEYKAVLNGTVLEIHGPGGLVATSNALTDGQPITFAAPLNTINLGTWTAADAATFGGTGATIGNMNSNLNITSDRQFANISETKTLQVISDTNTVLGEATYSGNNTVTLGDISINVDRDKLNAYFTKSPKPLLEDATSKVKLGDASLVTEKDWLYENNAANAQPGVGESVVVGVIALAKVPNMFAMEQSGNSYFVTTANSGEATFSRPGINNSGTLVAGYLEMSNVDVSKEFTEMITTQRGFQANTRIITVSDEMLNELVNLKR